MNNASIARGNYRDNRQTPPRVNGQDGRSDRQTPSAGLAKLLHLAKLGFRIFPLRRHAKVPVEGFMWKQKATTDPEQIRRWWKSHRNWAMVLGPDHCGIDVDMKDGRNGERSLETLEERHQHVLPETLTSHTGHGGQHLTYFIPKDKKLCTSKDKLGPGLEVRTGAQYQVIPPSIHPDTGKEYRWDDIHTPIATLPDWFLQAANRAAKGTTNAAKPSAATKPNGKIKSSNELVRMALKRELNGGRNDVGLWLACQLRDIGLSPDEVEQIGLNDYVPRVPEGSHPYTAEEWRGTVKSVFKKPPREPLRSEEPAREAEEGNTAVVPAQMVDDVEDYLRKYVILPEAAYLPTALWVVGTHSVIAFDCFPYLAVLSPTKRCGKTRLFEAIEQVVCRPFLGTAPTPAALYRMIATCPTLLLDEVEILNGKNKSETALAVLAILNAGHRKGVTIPRCDGAKHELVYFPTYGPKAFAAIGRLPDTLTDRSIAISMQRRTKNQKVKRFLVARATAEATPIKNDIIGFARAYEGAIRKEYVRVADADLNFLSDRDADLWFPLFTVCQVAAPGRREELEKAAKALSGVKANADVDGSLTIKLLADIRAVWPQGKESCFSSILVEALKALEESPWGEFQLTQNKLARMLSPFEVYSRQVRIGNRTSKGYAYSELNSALLRYLDFQSETSETNQYSCGSEADF